MAILIDDLPEPPAGKTGWPWTVSSEPLPDQAPSGRDWPTIAIVTPSYNQGQYLEETIRSVLLQGYPALKYAVMDGGSDDQSRQIIEKYAPFLTAWQSQPDEGQSDAINQGFDRVSGDIHAYINSDDFYLPDVFARVARHFLDGAQWVAGPCESIDESTGAKGYYRVYDCDALSDWFKINPFPQPGVFWAGQWSDRLNGFDEQLHYSFDYEFFLRLRIESGVEPIRMDEPVAVWRLHEESKTTQVYERFLPESHQAREQLLRRLSPGDRAAARRALRAAIMDAYQSTALRLARQGRKKEAWQALGRSIRAKPSAVTERRTWGAARIIARATPQTVDKN